MSFCKKIRLVRFLVRIAFFLFVSYTFINCNMDLQKNRDLESKHSNQTAQNLINDISFINNGKKKLEPFDSILSKSKIDTFNLPVINKELAKGLKEQLKVVKYQKRLKKEYSGKTVSKKQLEETIKVLLASQFNNSFGMKSSLDAHQIWGEDTLGNVNFTGYFTPVLKVRAKPNKKFKYPLYQFPKNWKGNLPSRKEIEKDGVLDTLNLEIAYTDNKIDIYFMQVQGSGYIEFPNGKKKLLAFAGTNKHPYRSIGKYMIRKGYATPDKVSLKSIKSYFKKNPEMVDSILFANPSYVFFTPVTTAPRGAGHVALTPEISIAVDKKIVPLGSCFLAQVPILDKNRNFSHHEYRILLAQDIGGAIKGTGHVDLYRGIGQTAEKEASALHHYGNLWWLLPKDTIVVSNE